MVKLTKVTLILSSLLICTELLSSKLTSINHEQHSKQVISKLNKEIKTVFNDALITSEVLKEMTLLSGDRTICQQKFNQLSKKLLETYSNVDGLLYLPNGIVEFAYPYQEHKLAIGHNVLADQNRKRGANKSIESSETTIIGPLKLVQNGKIAFILRKSISDENGFIGLTSSVVYLDSILTKIEAKLKEFNVQHYTIVGYNPDSTLDADRVISSNGSMDKTNIYKDQLHVFETKWDICISPNSFDFITRLGVFLSLSAFLLLIFGLINYFNKYKDADKQRHNLQKEAHTDFLTGLLNRRGFEAKFDSIKHHCHVGTIAIFDIDFFKNINDTYGHDIGDIVLVQFAKICSDSIQEDAIFSRTGGEEFMLLMPNTDDNQAQTICEALRQAVANTPLIIEHQQINITVSIGIASFANSDKMETAVSSADKALYLAKRTGRNRVCVN